MGKIQQERWSDLYPNPVQSGESKLTLSGYEGIEEIIETHVVIINMTGEIVFAERLSCGGGCTSYLMSINKQLVPGVYVVKIEADGVPSAKRLLVK